MTGKLQCLIIQDVLVVILLEKLYIHYTIIAMLCVNINVMSHSQQ